MMMVLYRDNDTSANEDMSYALVYVLTSDGNARAFKQLCMVDVHRVILF